MKVDGSKVTSVLLIDETLDAATPYSGSLEVRKLFPDASLIALPGGTTHADSLFGDACEDNQIAAYLADRHAARRASRATGRTRPANRCRCRTRPPQRPRPRPKSASGTITRESLQRLIGAP